MGCMPIFRPLKLEPPALKGEGAQPNDPDASEITSMAGVVAVKKEEPFQPCQVCPSACTQPNGVMGQASSGNN